MEEKTTIFRVIDRKTARAIARVFMSCYRKGVIDGKSNIDDEGLIHEHLDVTSTDLRFGFIGSVTDSYVYWKNRLLEIAEECGCYNAIFAYFNRLGKFRQNYLSVFVVLAQRFYNRGLEDFMKFPNQSLSKFCQEKELKVWWTENGGKKFDFYRLRAYIQDLCTLRVEKINRGEGDILKYTHYESFSTMFSFAIVAK